MVLSILLPAKRACLWEDLYRSIADACSSPWEVIIVSHISLPDALATKPNIRYIYSERSPLHKQQQALSHARGVFTTWLSDDCSVLPGAYDKTLYYMTRTAKKREYIIHKYLEGEELPMDGEHKTNHEFMRSDEYYMLKNHSRSNLDMFPDETPCLSFATIRTDTIKRFGGWDCRFEVCPMAHCDLAARMTICGEVAVIEEDPLLKCLHFPGTSGDHAATHHAQTGHDEPLLRKIWRGRKGSPGEWWRNTHSWEDTPEVWERRQAHG